MRQIFFQLIGTVVIASFVHGQGQASEASQIKAKVQWRDANSKPSDVEFQNPGAGNEDFKPWPSHYYGEKKFPNIRARQKIVVRWSDGSSILFDVNARVDAKVFSFTVEKPRSQLSCNNSDVDLLINERSTRDMDKRIALMQSARALLSKKTNPCSNWNRRRLAKLNFDLSCNLAKETTFFDLSTDAAIGFREEFPNSINVARQISSCRNEVVGQVLTAAYNASRSAKKANNTILFSNLNDALLNAMDDDALKGGFAKIGVSRVNLLHSKIEVLFAKYENREFDPQGAVNAAQQINDLSNDKIGRRAIVKSGLSIPIAKQLLPSAIKAAAAF